MKVKGINKAYDVDIKRMNLDGSKSIMVTAGNLMVGMTSVMITEEDWEKIKEAV